ncbi:hypothetical protein Aduo_004768 [Ancylostoma duodenale]
MRWKLFTILLLAQIALVTSRRRTSAAERSFDKPDGLNWAPPEEEDDKDSKVSEDNDTTAEETKETTTTTTSKTPRKNFVTEIPSTLKKEAEEAVSEESDVISDLLSGAKEILNITKQVEEKFLSSLDDETNRTVLWIDASYKAEDFNLNTTSLPECQAWRKFWSINATDDEDKNATSTADPASMEDIMKNLKETELIKDKKKLKKLGLDENLLKEYKAVGLVYKEICGDHGRILWFRDTSDAKDIGITEASPICEPFKEDLTPDTEKLALLAKILNEMVQNFTEGIPPSFVHPRTMESSTPGKDDVVTTLKDGQLEETTAQIQRENPADNARRNNLDTARPPKSISTLGVPHPIPDTEGTSYLVVEEANDHKAGVDDQGRRRANEPEQKPIRRVESVAQGHSYVNNDIMEHEEDYPEERED